MKSILGIAIGVTVVCALSWMLLEFREGRFSSSHAAPAETPTLLQSAGNSITYNFDNETVGNAPSKFHGGRTGQGTDGKWAVVDDATAPSKPNVVAQTS